MRFDEISGTKVVSVSDAQELGRIDDVLIELQKQRVLGFEVKVGGLFSAKRAVTLADVKSIGPDAVTVETPDVLNDRDAISDLKDAVGRKVLHGAKVLDERGIELGHVGDIDANFDTGEILSYVLGETLMGRVRGQERVVAASSVKSLSEQIIVVEAAPSTDEGPGTESDAPAG